MDRKLFTAIEVALIGGLILAVLYWGGVFGPRPIPQPSATPPATEAVLTPAPTIVTVTITPTSTLLPRTLPLVQPTGLIAFNKREFNSAQGFTHEIYVVDVEGLLPDSTPLNLSNNPADDYLLAWSPDGTRLAFFSNRSGWQELYVMNADGSNVVQLTNTQASQTAYREPVSWSSDGTFLVAARRSPWAAQPEAQVGFIDRIRADGSGVEMLYGSVNVEQVRLSPDDRYIAMYTGGAEGYGVYVAPINDGLVDLQFEGHCREYHWVPGTSDLVCHEDTSMTRYSQNGMQEGQFFSYAVRTQHMSAAWSPNGKLLLVQTGLAELINQPTIGTVWLFHGIWDNLSYSNLLLFSTHPGWSWAPDNEWVAFTASEPGRDGIYIFDVYNPADIRQLVTPSGGTFAPQWQPNHE